MEEQNQNEGNVLNEAQASAQEAATESISVLGGLLDFTFKEFITTKVIKILYIVGILVAALAGIGMILGGFAAGFVNGLFALIIVPIFLVLQVIGLRIGLELTIVVFNIARDVKKIADKN